MDLAKRCSVLGSTTRVNILNFLRDNSPATVPTIGIALLGSTYELVSLRRHLKILCRAGFCARRRIGRAYSYYLTADRVPVLLQDIQELFGLHS